MVTSGDENLKADRRVRPERCHHTVDGSPDGHGWGIFFFLLMLALILVVGARFAISVHDDTERQSHTSLSHIVLENSKTPSPAPNPNERDGG